MSRLIDSNKLEEKIEEIDSIDYGSMDSFEAHNAVSNCLRDIIRIIDDQPVVDSVPVVRCKNCIDYNPKLGCMNYLHPMYSDDFYNHMEDDDFCSYGKRKDE